jgi:uncharacterized Tic20 family protein
MEEQPPLSAPPVLGSTPPPAPLPAPTPSPAPSPSPTPTPGDVRTWHMACHMAALANLTSIPFAGVLGPLIVWQIKKNEIPSVEQHAKDAINFQLTVWIAAVVAGIGTLLGFLLCLFFVFLPVLILIGLAGIIFPIIAGIKANSGEPYSYPWSFKFLS